MRNVSVSSERKEKTSEGNNLVVLGQSGKNKNNWYQSYKKGGRWPITATAPPYLLEEHRYEKVLYLKKFFSRNIDVRKRSEK